ncbi:hypothetical protein KKA13_02850 [Patescibacteria group bacterium]|nr:hypothetical protein [Patescibacteria group bacterium]
MFSALQINILKECYENRRKIHRSVFLRFYRNKKTKTTPVKIITQSLDRLIGRGYIFGYCVHKSDKCYIENIKITPVGIRAYEDWWARRQRKLPF